MRLVNPLDLYGRMYDPKQARMLAVDNFVQDPYSTQAYNRYSYVLNNPLAYTDPSGETPWWVASIVSTAVSYLINSARNNSWNPNEWTSGSIGFGVNYSQGYGAGLSGGGNFGSFSLVAGGSSSGAWGGGQQLGPGMPSYSEVPGGSIPGINWGGVDAAAGWSPVQMGGPSGNQDFFVWQTDYSDMSGATAGGGVGDPPGGRWTRLKTLILNKVESIFDQAIYTGTSLPASMHNGFRYGYNEIVLGKRMVLRDSQKWSPWRFSLSDRPHFYQEATKYGSNNTVSRKEGARLVGGTATLIQPPFLTPKMPLGVDLSSSLIFGEVLPYWIDE